MVVELARVTTDVPLPQSVLRKPGSIGWFRRIRHILCVPGSVDITHEGFTDANRERVHGVTSRRVVKL